MLWSNAGEASLRSNSCDCSRSLALIPYRLVQESLEYIHISLQPGSPMLLPHRLNLGAEFGRHARQTQHANRRVLIQTE